MKILPEKEGRRRKQQEEIERKEIETNNEITEKRTKKGRGKIN